MTDHDPVNRPAHYDYEGAIQPVDAMEAWGPFWPHEIAIHLSQVVPYIGRCGRKGDPVEDLRKARWWIDRAIRRLTSTDLADIPVAEMERIVVGDATKPAEEAEAISWTPIGADTWAAEHNGWKLAVWATVIGWTWEARRGTVRAGGSRSFACDAQTQGLVWAKGEAEAMATRRRAEPVDRPAELEQDREPAPAEPAPPADLLALHLAEHAGPAESCMRCDALRRGSIGKTTESRGETTAAGIYEGQGPITSEATSSVRTDTTNREAGYEPGARPSTSKTEGSVTVSMVPRPPRLPAGSPTDG